MTDASDRVEERAAAVVILDEHPQHVANRIAVGAADHCLPELQKLEAGREHPREPVVEAIQTRLSELGDSVER